MRVCLDQSGVNAQALMRAARVTPSAAAKYVIVQRDPAIQEARLQLPILKDEFTVRLCLPPYPFPIPRLLCRPSLPIPRLFCLPVL